MTYYEELGVDPSAGTDEIRHAYRAVARVLHPDRQAKNDPEAAGIAARQMQRLNGIMQTLGDPYLRRKYDLSIAILPEDDLLPEVVPAPRPWRPWASSALWTVVALAGAVAGLIYLAEELRPEPRLAPPAAADVATGHAPAPRPEIRLQPPAPRRDPADAAQISVLREKLASLQAERDAALAESARLRARQGTAVEQRAVESEPSEEPPRSSTDVRGGARAVSLRHFAGNWFYVRPRVDPASGTLYPPEYIELLVVEENGSLRGRYRARYQIADRAISPEVNFHFEGQANTPVSNMRWANGEGASGEVRLKLLADHALQVDWFATDIGGLGLASGTAVLVRKQP